VCVAASVADSVGESVAVSVAVSVALSYTVMCAQGLPAVPNILWGGFG